MSSPQPPHSTNPPNSTKNQPKIPNLLTSSRFSKAKPSALRGPSAKRTSTDEIVQQTDDDAAGSRLSAVERGYLNDAFARAFVAGGREGVRRMPIINRGTYVRTRAIDTLITRFLATTTTSTRTNLSTASTPTGPAPPEESAQKPDQKHSQIISLGAGTDTRPFRLLSQDPSLSQTLKYHELDFSATTAKKVATIDRTPELRQLVSPSSSSSSSSGSSKSKNNNPYSISNDKTSLKTPCYELTAGDLRDLAAAPPTTAKPDPHGTAASPRPFEIGIDPAAPTLILSECCLTYLPAATSTAILAALVERLSPGTRVEVVLYEPLEPADAFGRTMVANLAGRGIAMPGMEAFPSVEKQKERLRGVLSTSSGPSAAGDGGGWETRRMDVEVQGWTTKEVWDAWVAGEEKERLRDCEMVDEEEEWVLLAGHYGVIWGCRRSAEEGEDGEGSYESKGLVIESGG